MQHSYVVSYFGRWPCYAARPTRHLRYRTERLPFVVTVPLPLVDRVQLRPLRGCSTTTPERDVLAHSEHASRAGNGQDQQAALVAVPVIDQMGVDIQVAPMDGVARVC